MTYTTDDAYTEHWLESQTRRLTLPDGTTRLVTAMRLAWSSFDYLVDECGLAPVKVISCIQEAADLNKRTFDHIFADALFQMSDDMRRIRQTRDEAARIAPINGPACKQQIDRLRALKHRAG